jgi:protein CWC15
LFLYSSKRPKLDQVPAASLDADDPLDEENSDDPDSDDDTAQLLAELQRIKKERAMEQAKRVSREQAAKILSHLHELVKVTLVGH